MFCGFDLKWNLNKSSSEPVLLTYTKRYLKSRKYYSGLNLNQLLSFLVDFTKFTYIKIHIMQQSKNLHSYYKHYSKYKGLSWNLIFNFSIFEPS